MAKAKRAVQQQARFTVERSSETSPSAPASPVEPQHKLDVYTPGALGAGSITARCSCSHFCRTLVDERRAWTVDEVRAENEARWAEHVRETEAAAAEQARLRRMWTPTEEDPRYARDSKNLLTPRYNVAPIRMPPREGECFTMRMDGLIGRFPAGWKRSRFEVIQDAWPGGQPPAEETLPGGNQR